MNKQQVIWILDFFNLKWDDFNEFMIGKTYSISDSGERIYWQHDVRFFVEKQIIKGNDYNRNHTNI